MGMAVTLGLDLDCFNKLSFPHPMEAPYEMTLIGQSVSEEKMFKERGRRKTLDDDGQGSLPIL